MKKVLFLILTVISLSSCAQKETFDIVNFTAPKGWQKSENAGTLTLSKDKGTEGFCIITIYKSLDASDNAQANFDMSWEALVQKNLENGKAVMQPDDTDNGWEIKTGSAPFDKENIKGVVMLVSGSKNKKLVNIMCTTNTTAFQKEMETFFSGIVLKEDLTTAPQNQANNLSQTNNTVISGNSKYDLWMAHKLSLNGKLGDMSFQYVVISSDNRCLFHFPEKGLNNLEQDFPASADSWGNVTDQGNKLVLNNVKYGKMELYKKAANAMGRYANSKPGDYYKKCKPVDGIRIEGAYSPDVSLYKNKATLLDKIMYDPNKRPIIFFKKDGTYINEGIAFSNLTFGDDFAIGKGTYELKDFSIILTTSSGRKLQMNFAGILDANPANTTDGYIINGNLFYKLDNSYQSH